MDSLDQQLADNKAAMSWSTLQLSQLQTVICKSLTYSNSSDSIEHLLAVMYTLTVAAPTAVVSAIPVHSTAITRLVAMVSVVVSKQGSASAAHSWSQWLQLACAIGFPLLYLPAVLSPAAKAVLLQLEAAANAKHVSRLKLQVDCFAYFMCVPDYIYLVCNEISNEVSVQFCRALLFGIVQVCLLLYACLVPSNLRSITRGILAVSLFSVLLFVT